MNTLGMWYLAVALVLSLTQACDLLGDKRNLSGSDCIVEALETVKSCTGRNEGFQECRYYFRALGRPRRQVCNLLLSRPKTVSNLAEGSCDAMERSSEVNCSTYGLPNDVRCFACQSSANEATRTKLFAFSADCESGWEQATCNFDPKGVAAAVGK